ncbi:MAG: hypothetical protein QOE88_256 [Verrucomicrobiota bacterium]|nr:hypothetical protein [Verrucomicrobiota bacterium]
MIEGLLGRGGSIFFRQFLWFGRGQRLVVDDSIVGQKGQLRSFDGHGDGRPVEVRIQDQEKLVCACSTHRDEHPQQEQEYSAVEFAVSRLSRTSIQHHDILSRWRTR